MNLLIVDDDIPTTEVLRNYLDRELIGIDEIYTAFQVDMAKRIFTERQVDMILCDIEMPRENGLSFLEWVRSVEKQKTEFLFLTCYEKFEYARGAVEYEASNYLLKPIDIPKVTEALQKSAAQARRRQQALEYERMGRYWEYGQLKLIRNFWHNMVWGYLAQNQEAIGREIGRLNIPVCADEAYTAVFVSLDRTAVFEKDSSRELCRFLIENSISQVLEGKGAMENLTSFEDETRFCTCAFLPMEPEGILRMCRGLESFFRTYYGREKFAGYISERVPLTELYAACREMSGFDKENISGRGRILRFSQRCMDEPGTDRILEQKEFLVRMEHGERGRAIEYVENCCRSLENGDGKSIHNMRRFQTELLQSIHVYLYQRGIDAARLLGDRGFLELQEKAPYSVFDMMKWSICGVNKALDFNREMQKKKTVADQIEGYLRQHYTEDVTRNQVAAQLCLTPEYVGKLFKRERGVSIQDYVNSLRIERAAQLLASTDQKITDVALAVGFNNIPYFSTVFKKYMGVAPKDYNSK
ncbi:MAG: helix-turn-helix domain-containing protein [Eubacteriales bacterium]|nr:helix-turn-helix domain-containing protein [Eubacteriales bacterium]